MINTKKLTKMALFIALICIATMIIKIPIPAVNGYIHFGDAFVILAGIFLGPFYGAVAGGIGSALADVLSGYIIYAPVTFVVKGIMALGVGFLYNKLNVKMTKVFLCGVYSTFVIVIGYYCFESIMYGSAALASIPANIFQGLSGMVIVYIVLPFFHRINLRE